MSTHFTHSRVTVITDDELQSETSQPRVRQREHESWVHLRIRSMRPRVAAVSVYGSVADLCRTLLEILPCVFVADPSPCDC